MNSIYVCVLCVQLSSCPSVQVTSWVQRLDRLLDAGHLLLLDVLQVGGSYHTPSSQLILFFINLPFEIYFLLKDKLYYIILPLVTHVKSRLLTSKYKRK